MQAIEFTVNKYLFARKVTENNTCFIREKYKIYINKIKHYRFFLYSEKLGNYNLKKFENNYYKPWWYALFLISKKILKDML